MRPDWMSCDGRGGPAIDRRTALRAMAGAGAFWASLSTAWGQAVVHQDRVNRNVLVVVFLRGGADGLHLVVPTGEDAYYRARPGLGVAKKTALDLDGFFGFHPSLQPLHRRFHSGEVAVVHAVGSQDHTHSHFEAMATMESGRGADNDGAHGGWLARHLTQSASPVRALRAVSWGPVLAESLKGAPDAMAVNSVADLAVHFPSPEFERALRKAYERHTDVMSQAGRHMMDVAKVLRERDPSHAKPEGGAEYPKTPTGDALREAAFLIRQDIGLQVACLDSGGWDSHVSQSYLDGLMRDLANGLDAFARDLGPEMSRVTVVVMSEFGRRLAENSGLGTDHGGGGMMMVMGGGVRGGKVYADWPGLEPHQLAEPGDLRTTTDYRCVLAELLERRLDGHPAAVFPGASASRLGLLA